ncbi:hypothetical protein HYC85_019434 [Camellia sinensis]|uniref:Pentatricopeptide repeat-containing protein n=1 Tax=Camellia sinensis TaxID=4442 RepID=A0A7J7GLU5_CAMSI|nr:hypothetical protein HYC85_019434 [Camellia sinensis]
MVKTVVFLASQTVFIVCSNDDREVCDDKAFKIATSLIMTGIELPGQLTGVQGAAPLGGSGAAPRRGRGAAPPKQNAKMHSKLPVRFFGLPARAGKRALERSFRAHKFEPEALVDSGVAHRKDNSVVKMGWKRHIEVGSIRHCGFARAVYFGDNGLSSFDCEHNGNVCSSSLKHNSGCRTLRLSGRIDTMFILKAFGSISTPSTLLLTVIAAFIESILASLFLVTSSNAVLLLLGLKPDIEAFNAIFTGLFLSSRCSAAQQLFNEMQVVGIIPNSQTYAIMLDGLCRNKNISEALSLFHKMERNNLDLNVVMYNTLIDTFCKDKKVDTARALFDNLSSKGLQPDVKTYTMMIQGLCEEGLLYEAKELFVKMEQNGCLLDGVTYNTIIRGFIGQHKCYEALILVEEMVQRGFSTDASTCPLIIDILSTKGQDPALQEVIKKFISKDSKLHGPHLRFQELVNTVVI